MAYDRYDTRDERSRWRDDRHGRRDDRGFFERAGDEVASWFGDEDAERRRREDQRMIEREHGWDRERVPGRDWGRSRFGPDEDRGRFARESYRGAYGEGSRPRSAWSGGEMANAPGNERGYRPMFGGYTTSEAQWETENYPRGDYYGRRNRESEEDRSARFASRHDPHYENMRQRHLDELDRDYDDYRRENQSRFESDFGSWRERRMQKRSLLSQIREHMEVVGNDDEHIGSVDRVARDRIILTKSDPESGGVHHSLSCADIDRVEGDRVVLDCSAEQARDRWRDESRSRALFEREDQGEMGDRALNRSFSGTYR